MKRLTIRGTGTALAIFSGVSFLLCVAWGVLLPSLHARSNSLLEALIPGFTWLTPLSVLLGLGWSVLVGFYVALLFVPLFNYFERGRATETPSFEPAPPRPAVQHS